LGGKVHQRDDKVLASVFAFGHDNTDAEKVLTTEEYGHAVRRKDLETKP
jgi:hypothetical protein